MRRIVDHQVLMCAVAVVFVAGCSNPSSPDLADRGDITEAEYDIVLPDSAEAVNLVTGEKVGVTARQADDSTTDTTGRHPEPVVIADGADSDSPDGYQTSSPDESNAASLEASQPPDEAVVDDEAAKGEGRRSDGDDPAAALVVPKIAEEQDEAPLDNGRGDSAKPLPEGQRVAIAPKVVASEDLEDGRTPEAEPGAEVATPVKASPTTKPTAPSREKLSDLAESIQALDKDADGQLGLYEWPRQKLAEFKTLDSNQDGFLTAAELVAGQKKVTEAKSKKTDKEPAKSSKEESKEKPATKTDDKPQPDDAKAPADTTETTDSPDTTVDEAEAVDATDNMESPDTTADEAEAPDASTDDEKPQQGS